jgi:hypothetical protein
MLGERASKWSVSSFSILQALLMVLPGLSSLPIEIFDEIACFVAGENNFGTLASLSATSKLMAQELKRVLYETIVWDAALMRRLRRRKAKGKLAEEIQHVK